MTANRTLRRRFIASMRGRRAGFTLIELLVVVGIILLLAAMTLSVVNLTVDGDKVRNGARQVQSYLEGARDRAIFSKQERGVRFLLDPTNDRTVSSMVFVGPTDPWTFGEVQLERLDADNDGTADGYNAMTNPNPPAVIVRGFDYDSGNRAKTEWKDLFTRRLLKDGARIRIPAGPDGRWYTISTKLPGGGDLLANAGTTVGSGTLPPRLRLLPDFVDSPTNTTGDAVNAFTAADRFDYVLELPPTVLPNQEPVLLPKGCVIDLDRCNKSYTTGAIPTGSKGSTTLPSDWLSSATPYTYSSQMDVMFSPRGVVVGRATQKGLIHFFLADQKDADRQMPWTDTAVPTSQGDRVIVSLFTRTGAISSHSVHPISTDPFKLAETGEVAGK